MSRYVDDLAVLYSIIGRNAIELLLRFEEGILMHQLGIKNSIFLYHEMIIRNDAESVTSQ